MKRIIPTDEEVLIRETQDLVQRYNAAVKRNRDGWAAINAEKQRLGWRSMFFLHPIPPPLPCPLSMRTRMIAENLGLEVL